MPLHASAPRPSRAVRRFVVASLALLAACGMGDAPSARRVEAIIGGAADTVDTNVVSIILGEGSAGAELCSGSLLAPNLVLTARHCVSHILDADVWCIETGTARPPTLTTPTFPTGNFLVGTNASLQPPSVGDAGSGIHFVVRVIVPADSDGIPLCGHDIALLELADNIPETEAQPLIPRLDIPPFEGETYSAIGFGATDTMGSTIGDRQIRTDLLVHTIGHAVPSALMLVTPETDEEWTGSRSVCGGDSGGPALSSHREVLGAVSRAAGGCGIPVYTRLDSYASLIRQAARVAAMDGHYEEPFWVVPNAPGSVAQGQPCLTDTDCGAQNDLCLFPADHAPRRLCLSTNCAQCPAGSACESTDSTMACVPTAASVDAGTVDAGVDARTSEDVATFTPPRIDVSGGCDARPRDAGGSRAATGCFALLAMAFVRRARSRRSKPG